MEMDRPSARLHEELERYRREVGVLAEIDHALATAPDPDALLQRIVEQAARLTRADGAGIAFIREGSDELEVGPAVGVLEAPPNRYIPLHASISGRVIRRGRAEVIPDVTRDPEQYPLQPDPVPTRSAVVVPLRTPEAVIGSLIVVRGPELPPFGTEQRDALQRFADKGAIVLEQARLVNRLREANLAKRQFVATLSHELRTPLTGILLWTDLLKANPRLGEIEEAAEAVDVITHSAEMLLAMVNELLDLGRLESGKLRLEREPVDLTVVARRAITAIRRKNVAAPGVVLIDDLPESLPPVPADPVRVQQILVNLLSNAAKFTRPPGSVTVRAEVVPDGGCLALEVEDTGIGIPKDFLPHIFEQFRQAESGRTRRHGGLGVGLTVAKALVDAHGGTISVQTEEGKGSTFRVELPLEPPAAAEPVEPDGEREQARESSGLRSGRVADADADAAVSVLVAEDVPQTRRALTSILSARGYGVLQAADGEEAVRIARAERPAAILMDIAMPGVDGIAALERLRADPATAGIPVAAITARAMPDDRRRIEAAGFDAHLVKPFRIAQLVGLLGTLLDPPVEAGSP